MPIHFKRYFLYALIIKAALFLLFAFLFNKNAAPELNVKYIFHYGGDFNVYMEPVMNLVDHGLYYERDEEKQINIYAYKMPGMLPIFGPIYYAFGFEWGLFILVLIQFLIDAWCCVLLGKIALKIFKEAKAFYFGFYLYAVSSIVSVTSHYANSEFFCTSFSIISLYVLTLSQNPKHIILSGLFAAWAVFLRPTSVLILVTWPFFILYFKEQEFKLFALLKHKSAVLLFVMPFIFFECVWIGRNYKLLDRFIPLDQSAEYFGTPGLRSVFSMVVCFGGDLQSWVPETEMRWFNNRYSIDYDSAFASTFPFPDYVLKSGVSKNELLDLRESYYAYDTPNIDLKSKKELEQILAIKSQTLIDKFKKNAPFAYYIKAPLRTLKMFVFIKRPYGFTFSNNGPIEKLVRAWHFVYYYFVLFLFLAGSAFLLIKKNRLAFPILALVIFHILLYGFILRFTENRYLVPMHPFIILVGIAFILFAQALFKNKFSQVLTNNS